MPRPIKPLALLALMLAVLTGCGQKTGRIADADIARFIAVKREQAKEMTSAGTNRVPEVLWQFFDAVERDDFKAATNLDARLKQESGRGYQATPTSPSP